MRSFSLDGSGVIFSLIPNIGERISMHLVEQGQITGYVRWVRGGKIGVSFAGPLE